MSLILSEHLFPGFVICHYKFSFFLPSSLQPIFNSTAEVICAWLIHLHQRRFIFVMMLEAFLHQQYCR